MSEWRTMESAPKDGTSFWGRVGEDAIAMFWHPKFEAFVSRFHRMTMVPGYSFQETEGGPFETEVDHSPTVEQPTAWMPLPAPPEQENGS